MNTYVLAFRGQPGRELPADADEKWGAWFAELGSSIVNPGSRVGDTTTVPAADAGDPATAEIAGFTLVSADDLAAATDLARGCPGLSHGVSVEVGELVEM
jgi:hypothetical protein